MIKQLVTFSAGFKCHRVEFVVANLRYIQVFMFLDDLEV